MVRLKLVKGSTHTTIDDERGHELPGWTYVEERSGRRSSGTLYKEGKAVAFFDRTAKYSYLYDPSSKTHRAVPRGTEGRFASLLEAIRCYEQSGCFLPLSAEKPSGPLGVPLAAPLLNRYRVEGAFTFLAFCYTNDSDLTECLSFEDCQGHESVKSVSEVQEAASEQEASTLMIDTFAEDFTDACWMYGQPTVTHLGTVIGQEVDLAAYWQKGSRRRNEIRQRLFPGSQNAAPRVTPETQQGDERAVQLSRAALRDFLHWRTSRGGMTKREAVEIAYDVLAHQRDPVMLTTATYTEWLSQGYEDYLVNGREGYIALGWGASPAEFNEHKRLAFRLPKETRTHT